MAAAKKTYRLAPNWDYPPNEEITLASIIMKPDEPDLSLRSIDVGKDFVTTTIKDGFVLTREDKRSGLWASIITVLGSIGFRFEANMPGITYDNFRIEKLETHSLKISKRFIASCIYHKDVEQYTKRHHNKPIYLITGIKVAYGATMESTLRNSHSGMAKAGFEQTPAVPNTDFVAQYQNEHQQGMRFGTQDGFVFAYRLVKIQPKDPGDFDYQTYERGALLHDGDLEETDTELIAKLEHEWDFSDESDFGEKEVEFIEDLDCKLAM